MGGKQRHHRLAKIAAILFRSDERREAGPSHVSLLLMVLLHLIGAPSLWAASETILYSFSQNPFGANPTGALLLASDGNLYGTTGQGGPNGLGTVFKISNLAGTPTRSVIYNFATWPDGSGPIGSLIQASDGNLYGITSGGGTTGGGTIYRIGNLSGTQTKSTIYSFTSYSGIAPFSSLIQAADGNLYGTTSSGGANNYGSIYQVSSLGATPAVNVIYNFAGGYDGSSPSASLIQTSDGNLYGTTGTGGGGDQGTVFKISHLDTTPTESVVYSFTGGADGATPAAALVQAADGTLYGTTYRGGSFNYGTIFEIQSLEQTPTESVIHNFDPEGDGNSPGWEGSLIQATDGNLYGATLYGGAYGLGVIFRVSDLGQSPTETVIYNFAGGSDGASPDGALIAAADGTLYGTTFRGDSSNMGTVFRISSLGGTSKEEVIYSFATGATGINPFSSVIQASDGNLYGTTQEGPGTSNGAVFRISDLSGTPTESVIHTLGSGKDGASSIASLMQASDGNLYGTTWQGGTTGNGTVFQMSNLGGTPVEKVIHSFSGGIDGAEPEASVMQASDGNLYGTTAQGGANGCGTVFRIRDLLGTATEDVVFSFDCTTDGGVPVSSLVQASDGRLYGTTSGWGPRGFGTVFRINNLGGMPTGTVVYSFAGGMDGANPYGGLIEASDGTLYGTTSYGGVSADGTVFRLSNVDGVPTETVLHSFSWITEGINPYGSLLQASDGNLYGATTAGVYFPGTVFRISYLGGVPVESIVYGFTMNKDGNNPVGPLIQGTDGNLYGMTATGGQFAEGTVFRLSDAFCSAVLAPLISGSGAKLCAGEPLSLSATAGFDSYQWYQGGNTIRGATASNYLVTSAAGFDGGSYTVVGYQSDCPSSLSEAYPVTVESPITPEISGPASACVGSVLQLSAKPASAATYRWSVGGQAISDGPNGNGSTYSGSGTAILTISNIQLGDAGSYLVSAIDTNSCSSQSAYYFELSISSCTIEPVALAVDPVPNGALSDGNAVFEPGETVVVEPTWKNVTHSEDKSVTGTGSSFFGPGGLQYSIADGTATYGSIQPGALADCSAGGCFQLGVSVPVTRPSVHWDSQFKETPSDGSPAKVWTLHLGDSFSDVSRSDVFYPYIETLLHNSVTVGCGTGANGRGLFCESAATSRGQMAAFVSRAMGNGDANVPAAGTGYICFPGGSSNFTDVLPTDSFCRHANYLYVNGVTLGCGGTSFCPDSAVTRGQMAAFISRAIVPGGDPNVPNSVATGARQYDCTSSSPSSWPFTDVSNTNMFCKYIGYLWSQSIVDGFGNGTFGPDDTLTRGQASKFLVNGFKLRLYGP